MRDLAGMPFNGDLMSNFDHTIDKALAVEAETSGKVYEYPAWNFHGRVWKVPEGWTCQVWCYRIPVAELTASTLEALMSHVCDEYGSD